MHGELGLTFSYSYLCGFGGPKAILYNLYTLVFPIQLGRQIECHIQVFVRGEIRRLVILGVVFRTGSSAARSLRCLVAEWFGGIESYGILIASLITLGIERTYNLVIQSTLVVVHITRVVGVIAVEVTCQFEQVVCAASFIDVGITLCLTLLHTVCCHAQHLGIWLSEHLHIAYATGGIYIASLEQCPEVLGKIIVIRIAVAPVTAQGPDNHRDVLVGMTRAYIVDVPRQWVEELWGVKAVGCFDELGFLSLVVHHLRQTGKRLADASHLACDIHIPHLVAVARTLASFLLCSVLLDVSAVVHAVPHPQSHILGYEQCLVGDTLVIEICSNVDKTCKLLVNRVIRSPYALGVIIWGIFLDEGAVLCGNGVEITISIAGAVFLVDVESIPCALHLAQFILGCKVTCLTVTSEGIVIYEGALLALAQLVDHTHDVLPQYVLLHRVGCHCICLGNSRHIVTRTMSLELAVGSVPTVTACIAFG